MPARPEPDERLAGIEPAGRDRIDALAAVYARAFLDDPIVRWPLPDTPDVHDRIRQVFASIYLGIADDGVIWEVGDADGFAVWIPAGAADDMFESDAAVQRSLAPLTADDGERYRRAVGLDRGTGAGRRLVPRRDRGRAVVDRGEGSAAH